MAKKTLAEKPQLQLLDVIALFAALIYMQSVLTVAHHTGMWIHDGSTRTVGPPAIAALVIGLALSAYSWSKKRGFSTVIVVTLTVLATSSLFWLSGLRANFFS